MQYQWLFKTFQFILETKKEKACFVKHDAIYNIYFCSIYSTMILK